MVSEIISKLKDGARTFSDRISNSPSVGIIYAILSTLFFSYNYFAAQEVIRLQKDFPIFEIVFMRSLIQLLLIIPYIYIKKAEIIFEKEKWGILLQLTLISYLIMVLGYVTLIFIPTSLMLPISATCPLFAILFSVHMLNDNFAWLDAVCGIIALIGVLFIARPKFLFGVHEMKKNILQNALVFKSPELNYSVGCILAISFGAMKALFFTLVKRWTFTSTGFTSLIFYPSLLGVAVTPMIMLVREHVFVLPKTSYETYCLVVASVFTLLGSLANMIAMETQSPTVVSIIRNLDILWGFLLQFAFLRVWPSVWSVGGSILIIFTTMAACFRREILNKLSTKEEYSRINDEN